ncbi:MAG: hypothetical protein RRZ84_01250 [Romboutsia sp.]
MKCKKILKIISVILLATVSMFLYNSFFGNPISYINAKSNIKSYINKNYDYPLDIEDLNYSFKTNGYSAIVIEDNDSRYKSGIEYNATNNIYDHYQFDIKLNIENEVQSVIEAFINQSTDLKRGNMSIWVNIDISKYKYKLSDKYSGKESMELDIYLHPEHSYSEEDKNKNVYQEVALYKNIDEFSRGVYDIINILKNTN